MFFNSTLRVKETAPEELSKNNVGLGTQADKTHRLYSQAELN